MEVGSSVSNHPEFLPHEDKVRSEDEATFQLIEGGEVHTEVVGRLTFTSFRLYFDFTAIRLCIPYGCIGKCDVTLNDEIGRIELEILCKDWRFVRIFVNNVKNYEAIKEHMFHHTHNDMWREPKTIELPDSAMENFLASEYQRLGFSDYWTISEWNIGNANVPTYPAFLLLPKRISLEVLEAASRFRTQKRISVATYIAKNGAVLARSSQPRTGLWSHCKEDEDLVDAILNSTDDHESFIFDCRPFKNAAANMAVGGYEGTGYPPLTFLYIENIHAVRNSQMGLFRSLFEVEEKSDLWPNPAISSWMKHLHSILKGTLQVAEKIQNGDSALVHCSDGWDRTAQICGLVQILVDPRYRTIEGFLALILKEWIAFGHKFHDRLAHAHPWTHKEACPIFEQWLDCVWQILRQSPSSFEFTEDLLISIAENMKNRYFAEFNYNTEKDFLKSRHPSLYQVYIHDKAKFVSQNYEKSSTPHFNLQLITFWDGYYCRFYRNTDIAQMLLSKIKSHKEIEQVPEEKTDMLPGQQQIEEEGKSRKRKKHE